MRAVHGVNGALYLRKHLARFQRAARNREVEAFVTIYATAIGRRAYEYKEKQQGYFTWALIEGLNMLARKRGRKG